MLLKISHPNEAETLLHNFSSYFAVCTQFHRQLKRSSRIGPISSKKHLFFMITSHPYFQFHAVSMREVLSQHIHAELSFHQSMLTNFFFSNQVKMWVTFCKSAAILPIKFDLTSENFANRRGVMCSF